MMYIFRLNGLILDHTIETPDPENIKHMCLSLISMWNQFLDSLAHFAEEMESNVKLCKVELEKRWSSLKSPLEDVRMMLTSESLYDPTSAPAECIETIEGLQQCYTVVSYFLLPLFTTI